MWTHLAIERRARWVVTAMDQAMAVGAGTIEDEPGPRILRPGWVTSLDVTLLAEAWLGDLEELLMV